MGKYLEYAEQREMEGSAQDITPRFHEFKEKGDTILGQFISRSKVRSKTVDGFYSQYVFDTDIGRVKFHLGAATDADIGDSLTIHGIYSVTFDGKDNIGGGKSVNKFTIRFYGMAPEDIKSNIGIEF